MIGICFPHQNQELLTDIAVFRHIVAKKPLLFLLSIIATLILLLLTLC